jgi:hypothetical protein
MQGIMGAMRRRILIGLAVLLGLLVVLDIGARFAAEAATAKALMSSLSLSSQPKVTIQGEPFLIHLVSGSFPTVTIEGQEVNSGPLTLKSVHAVLHDVHVPVLALTRGQRVTVRAASGSGTATVTAAEITSVLQSRGLGVTVEFARGRVRVQVPGIPALISASLAIESGELVLQSARLGERVAVALPRVIPGVRYTDVRLSGDEAVLGFQLRGTTFAVGG